MEENKTTDIYLEIDKAQTAEQTKKPIWAIIASLALHPLLMTTYAVALLFVYTDFKYIFHNQFFDLIIRVIFFSVLIPLVTTYFYKRGQFISSMTLKQREDYLLPLFTTFIAYSLLLFVFYKGNLYTWFLGLLAVPILLIAICTLINLRWKISAYMVGIGALIGSVMSVAYNIKLQNPYEIFVILIILAGILGSARLVMQKSTPAQVYFGFIFGFVVAYVTIFIAWYFPILYLLFIQ